MCVGDVCVFVCACVIMKLFSIDCYVLAVLWYIVTHDIISFIPQPWALSFMD
jgi:hypothetical protein